MPGHAIRTLTCHVCNRRKARYKDGCCGPCHFLILAEGTQDQYSIATESKTMTAYRGYAREYNKLARQGKRQLEIAEAMGYTIGQMRNLVYRMKNSGLKIVNLKRGFHSADSKLVAINKMAPRVNDHGGGKWGVTDCKCDLCKERRKASRKIVETRRSRKIKELQARIVELEKLLADARARQKM